MTALLQASYLGSKSCCSENLRKNRLAGRFFRLLSKRLRCQRKDLKRILFHMPTPEVKPAPLRDTNYQNKIMNSLILIRKKTNIIMIHNHPTRSIKSMPYAFFIVMTLWWVAVFITNLMRVGDIREYTPSKTYMFLLLTTLPSGVGVFIYPIEEAISPAVRCGRQSGLPPGKAALRRTAHN